MSASTTMTPHTLIARMAQQLAPEYDDKAEAEQVAWWLLQAATGKTKEQLLTHNHTAITATVAQKLDTMIDEHIVDHKPIAYIIGSVPFLDLTIFVEPPTLIPRPETEEWVARLIQQLQPVAHQRLTILDLCTGSGCIALALAQALPRAHIVGIDIAPAAVALAQRNAAYNKITNVSFVESDLYTQLPSQQFDLIVSNPPYISQQQWRDLPVAVRNWEDEGALIADDQGLAAIARIIKQAPRWLSRNNLFKDFNIPMLVIEIDYRQSAAVSQCMRSAQFVAVTVAKDMTNRDRVVTGSLYHESEKK